MQISTRGRYALQFLLDLSQHTGEQSVPLKDIAARQGISKKYLERIISLLGPSGILAVSRGYQGGYRLTRKPDSVTVAEVLRYTEGSLLPVPAEDLDAGNPASIAWRKLENAVSECLEGITLQDILDEFNPPVEIEYYI